MNRWYLQICPALMCILLIQPPKKAAPTESPVTIAKKILRYKLEKKTTFIDYPTLNVMAINIKP